MCRVTEFLGSWFTGRRLMMIVALVGGLIAAGWGGISLYESLNPPRTTTPLKLSLVAHKFPPRAGTVAPFTTVPTLGDLKFNDPVFVATLPDGSDRVVVLERLGRIHLVDPHAPQPTKKLFLDITDRVGDVREMGDDGLSGIAFHPQFDVPDSPHRGEFYLHYSCHLPGDRAIRCAKFKVPSGSDVADVNSEVVLIHQPDFNPSHNGGTVLFGPDGFLYFTVGDDDVRHPNPYAQRIDRDLFSGVLRIDVDCRGGDVSHPPPRQPNIGTTAHYFIPNDNPFVGKPGVLEEFYAIGLRNPWRASFDRTTGKLWVSDVGEHRQEEVNIVEKGANCGWSYVEGSVWSNSHHPDALGRPEEYLGKETWPIWEYPRNAMNRCIIGGYVYRGKQFPELRGKYVYGDYSGRVYALTFDEHHKAAKNELIAVVESKGHGISSFGEDADGELYVCFIGRLNEENGFLLRLERTRPEPHKALPQMLSETGIFSDLPGLKPAKGLVPFEVVNPLWSDRAHKIRWASLPEGKKIEGKLEGPWQFPAGSVFVKHFDLPLDEREADNPGKWKRLETRVLIVDDRGEAYGATYRWNDDCTDARLLDFSEDEEIEYTDVDGKLQRQTWTYPGRFECMVCHNPQAGFVLGFKARQLNRDVTCDGVTQNQLQRFADSGMFAEKITPKARGKLTAMAALDDEHASVETRVRSYLDSNCSHCHRPGRYAGRWDGRFEKSLDKQRIVDGDALFHLFADPKARVVKPQNLEHSYMYQRLATTHADMRMPPLGRTVVDHEAVALIRRWIEELPPSQMNELSPLSVRHVAPLKREDIPTVIGSKPGGDSGIKR